MKTNPYIITFEIYKNEIAPYTFERVMTYDQYEELMELLKDVALHTKNVCMSYGFKEGELYNRVSVLICI